MINEMDTTSRVHKRFAVNVAQSSNQQPQLQEYFTLPFNQQEEKETGAAVCQGPETVPAKQWKRAMHHLQIGNRAWDVGLP